MKKKSIKQKNKKVEKTEVVTESVKTPEVQEEIAEKNTPEKKTHTIVDRKKILFEDLVDAFHSLKVTNNGNIYTYLAPYIKRDLGMMNITFNSQYAKIVIDKNDKTISIWRAANLGAPDTIVRNSLLLQ